MRAVIAASTQLCLAVLGMSGMTIGHEDIDKTLAEFSDLQVVQIEGGIGLQSC